MQPCCKVLLKYHKLKIMIIYAKGKIKINNFIMYLLFIFYNKKLVLFKQIKIKINITCEQIFFKSGCKCFKLYIKCYIKIIDFILLMNVVYLYIKLSAVEHILVKKRTRHFYSPNV